jgi:hypothetical protein
LIALGISSRIATGLLQKANLPSAPFIHNQPAVKPVRAAAMDEDPSDCEDADGATEFDEPDEDSEPDDCEPPLVASNLSGKSGPKAASIAERDAKAFKVAAAANAKRFEHIRQGKYFGIYDTANASQTLLHSQEEADEYLQELVNGRQQFKAFYSAPGNSRNRSLEPIDYKN